MLNARPVSRDDLESKPFRPAAVELRPRTGPPAPNRHQKTSDRWSWLRPVALVGLLGVLSAATVLSATGTDRITGAVTEVQTRVAETAEGARRAWDRHLRTTAVAVDHHNLQRDHARLRMEVMHLRSLERERGRLVDLLQMSGQEGLQGVGARVVARGGGGRRTLRVDAGTEKGIRPGLAVISRSGVVGQVLDAGTGWADVLCLTDPEHGLAAVLEGGPHGTLRGTRDGLALDHVLARTEVGVGTPVFTSGEGGVFPADLPVGVVVSARPDRGTPFLHVDVEPVAPPDLLDEVMVVTGRTERPEIAIR